MTSNQLHYGDNLRVMQDKIPDEVADLIYLDPPFNSARNYNLLFRQVKGDSSPAQIMAFEDTWKWSPHLYDEFQHDPRNARLFTLVHALYDILGPSEMMAYVLMMAPRLLELHRKLKPTGSLYLHCDPTASHYLKIILDVVFGPESFVNEIPWLRTNAHNNVGKGFSRLHDVLLFYRRGANFTWHPPRVPFSPEQLRRYKPDIDGRLYTGQDLTITGNGKFGRDEWRGTQPPATRSWAYSLPQREDWFSRGLILLTKEGRPRLDGLKVFLEDKEGKVLGDVWTDINRVGNTSKERRGYPTQKPLALLERIIAASSNEGDVVLDPFCGCGTAIVAAERMNRRWIGIDITYLAISEVSNRLQTECDSERELAYELIGTPTDALGAQALFEETASQNHKPYEQFCVTLVRGEYREKKGADGGFDGVIHLWDLQGRLKRALIQVKGGNALTLSAVRDFARVVEREKAVMGLIISQKEPSKLMLAEAQTLGFADWPSQRKFSRMQIRTVQQLLETREGFDIPESYRAARHEGIGRHVTDPQQTLSI